MNTQIKKLKLIRNTTLIVLLLTGSISFSQTIDPFMTDKWGGVNCFDDTGKSVYPSNYYTPSHASAGCVAISMAQILHFYEWPLEGVGSNVFSDYYNGTLKRHEAYFDATFYDWDNMLDEYQDVASTDIEQKAVGELMYHVATSIEMDFGVTGSTSNVSKTPFAYKNFFRYASHYEDVSLSNFYEKLNENVLAGYPVAIAISATRTGDGHVVVANGFKYINGYPYYYLNWGWYNDNNINGWYNIQGWTSSTGGYNTVDGAVFDIMPNPQITSIEKTGSGNDFTVNWEVSSRINWNEFTLEQKVDEGDWTEVATGITEKSYTINNPAGKVYQFRVKVMIDGAYYYDSWSETEAYAAQDGFDGHGTFGGSQYAYARQTPSDALNFTEDYTFETWIRLKDNNSTGNVILDQQTVFAIEIADVSTTDYSVVFASHATGAELNSNATGAKLPNNEWVHIAISHSGTTTKLFVNGIVRDEDTSSDFNLISSTYNLNLASRYHSGYSGKIKADLDQVRISDVARFTSNFSPLKEETYTVDENTKLYLPFDNVHEIRLKDESSSLSFIVFNDTNYVEWNFDETSGNLSNETFELIQSSLTIYPNPVTNNNLQVSLSDNLDLSKIEFKVFDLQGRAIQIHSLENGFNNWNVTFTNTTPGMYVLQVIGDGFSATKKIMIK